MMKSLLVLILLLSSLYADVKRPKIALVLSGGGARGGAHVGVLRVLEQYKVPVDIIVGTSMGSFVGGMYVAGMSPDEIETMLTTTDWEKYITTDFYRPDTPMRKKNIDYTYQGRLGLGINSQNEVVLPTGVLKRQPMLLKFMELTQNVENIRDFDKLSIPYRAVATNIENGERVVLGSGSLAKAIYASSSIPGGFQPINIDGIELVDGGVSDNIPIGVAQEMGADIIIAVDVSEDFSQDLDVNSYIVVMGQLVNILMRKNANESLETLTSQDVLITPDLEGFTGLDADKYAAIIARGVTAATKAKEQLKVLSLSDAEYEEYRKKHRKKYKYHMPIIDKIEIENPTYLSNDSIRLRIHQSVGEELNLERLRDDLLHIYHMMIFDSVDYRLQKRGDQNILVITTTPSWDNRGEIRFAIGLEDDFVGHSAYSLKFGYTMYGLTSYGGEWRNDFEIGRQKKAYSEVFQPLDPMQRYYVKPSLLYKSITDVAGVVIDGRNLGNQEIFSSRGGATLAFGAHITTNYEVEIGASVFHDNVEIDVISEDTSYRAYPIYAVVNMDDLDNVNFPTYGAKAQIKWTKEMKRWGSDYSYEQFYFDAEKPFVYGANNLTLFLKYGNTYKSAQTEATDGHVKLAGTFTLGGLFNLSGYAPYSFIGENVALGVLRYTYELKDGGFFGTLNAPLYVGFSLEAGDAWQNANDFSAKTAGTIFVAADTFLGPFYLAYGTSSRGEESAYLYLGEKF